MHIELEMARNYYAVPGNEAGGNLHIALDDGNMEYGHVAYCLNAALAAGDDAGADLARSLLNLPEVQRFTLYFRLHDIQEGVEAV